MNSPLSTARYLALFLAVILQNTGAQDAPKTRVLDEARIFGSGDSAKSKNALEKELVGVSLETGAELFFQTHTVATNTSARELAAQAVQKLVPANRQGAVMVLVRSDNSIGVAVSEASEGIPHYVFSAVENPASGPGAMELHQFALRSGKELTSVFRKYYGDDAGKPDPRKSGDKILMMTTLAVVIVLGFGFGLIHWLGQGRKAVHEKGSAALPKTNQQG